MYCRNYDGVAVNIGDCNGEPGKYVNTIDDQKQKNSMP